MLAPSRSLRSDERLALLVADGNDAAFTTLYRRYEPALFGYCRSITRDTDDASDALQNAMLKALLALRRDERNTPLRPWLFRIVHNEAVNQLRRRPAVAAPVTESARTAVAGADEQAASRERVTELFGDLRELPLRQRAALVMRELGDLDYEEIALALDVTDGNARQLVFAARENLKARQTGRAMACESVRDFVLLGDARRLRRRAVRAHLSNCEGCTAFAAADPRLETSRAAGFAPWSPFAGVGLIEGLLRLAGAGASAVVGSTAAKTATAAVVVAAGVGVADVAREADRGSRRAAEKSAAAAPESAPVKTPLAAQPATVRAVSAAAAPLADQISTVATVRRTAPVAAENGAGEKNDTLVLESAPVPEGRDGATARQRRGEDREDWYGGDRDAGGDRRQDFYGGRGDADYGPRPQQERGGETYFDAPLHDGPRDSVPRDDGREYAPPPAGP